LQSQKYEKNLAFENGHNGDMCMSLAFVLINSNFGEEAELVRELEMFELVKDVYTVFGLHDIVVKLEAESPDQLKELVTGKIKRMSKVRSTSTLFVID